MKLIRLLIITVLSGSFFAANAQGVSVVGKVTTFQEYPLRNVSIVLKTAGTEYLTDSAGLFQFQSGPNEKLRISAHGFVTEDVRLKDYKSGDTLRVDLRFRNSEKNFNYATGYDYISADQLSSAIAHFESGPDYSSYNSIIEIIEGRVPGVSCTGSSIQIRSSQLLEGGTADALLVVDGVIVDYPVFIAVPPSQVKSIDMLKGAAASARYGSRGMGGVIVVKTKAAQ
ncbi:TonB-dependent receptor plug domain-containing protein [Mangrovibacterium marinum]|uniref:TonB-dependent SusC/RagA subfamily outer membrane receptor n=1 Tax=Mangrovibacterium marinum TaxID=1639118 RepID=A0A2T5C321_9BACT|nr:TonB-dependent receptor plug domain-containing protein [Mangrovibacterium marinum]PTN09097.1 TonB-dependent SusC/RagA subfamily outer membrane receptor [Mangrovibacterium marinum]